MSNDGRFQIGPLAIGAGALLGATLLAGRFSGLLREIELAAAFGVSDQADSAVLLLTLPDLFVNLLLSGGLSAALIPRLRALDTQRAQVLLRQILLFAFLAFAAFAAVFSLAPATWFGLLAPGLKAGSLPPSMAVAAAALAIPLTAASGVTTAGLNSQQRFFVAGCGTLIYNIIVIAALWVGRHGFAAQLVVLGIGIALGAAVRLLSQLVSLPRDWLLGPMWQPAPDVKFLRAFMAAAVTASLMLLVPVIIRALASTVSPGAIAALNYATKLVELPAGVLVSSLATVMLARLSEHYGRGDTGQALQALHDGVRRSLANAVGAGILIAYFAGAFVKLLLGRGAMDAAAISRVVTLTQIIMVGLPFLALASMAIADLNAQEKPVVVLKATLGCLVLLPVLALPGMWADSEILLAWAIVGFQVLHASCLVWLSGLAIKGARNLFDRKTAVGMLSVLGLSALAILFDWFLQSATSSNGIVRVALATMALGVVVVLPQRIIGRQSI